MIFSLNDIDAFEQRYRATFINSLGGFKSLGLIGTLNTHHQTNLAVFNSFFHVGAHPPLFGFVVRPDSVERHSLENIRALGCFTVNHVNSAIYKQAHQTSARYPAHVSEFSATGLSEEYLQNFPAPFVKESHVKLAAELTEIIPLKINNTLLVIARMLFVSLPENVVAKDGFVDLQQAGSITGSGLDAYYNVSRIDRLSYAKPDKSPSSVEW